MRPKGRIPKNARDRLGEVRIGGKRHVQGLWTWKGRRRGRHVIVAQWLKALGGLLMAAVGLTFVASSDLRSEEVVEFYRGRTLTLVVPTVGGSSYDVMSRIIARHLVHYIPGQPSIIVRNMPGAGGIAAANSIFRTAPRDGSMLAALQGSVPFEPLMGTPEAEFDPRTMIWLGSPSSETCVLTVWGQAKAKTIKDIQDSEIAVGSSGVNANPSFYARLLNAVLETKMRLVYGYPGQPDVFLAMEKGEVDGHPCVFWSALAATRPDWLINHKVNLPLQYGPDRIAEIPEVPFLTDLIARPEDKTLVDSAFAPLALGRPYVLPPEVPTDRVLALRNAMNEMLRDEGFQTEIRTAKLQITGSRTGEQVADLIKRTYEMPPAVLERLKGLARNQ